MPPDIFAACDDLSQMRAPVKEIYGGLGEIWKSIRGKHHIFEQKAMMVRKYFDGLGMDVKSGADDYRSQFCLDDLDGLDHFLGSQCGERPKKCCKLSSCVTHTNSGWIIVESPSIHRIHRLVDVQNTRSRDLILPNLSKPWELGFHGSTY